MNSLIFRYWAKAKANPLQYHLLPYHCLDVAAVGSEYLRHDDIARSRIAEEFNIPPSDIPEFIAFFLALHDLGKFTESFQSKIPEIFTVLQGKQKGLSVPIRHDSLGRFLWDSGVGDFFYNNELFPSSKANDLISIRLSLNTLLNAVFGHHGVPPHIEPLVASEIYTPQDAEAAKSFVSECSSLFLSNKDHILSLSKKEKKESLRAFSWPLAGLAVFADWIGSNSLMFPYCAREIPLHEYWHEIAVPRARSALSQVRILPFPISSQQGIDQLFPDFRTGMFTPSDLQRYASSCHAGPGPHLFIIEESTGSGKTEAALTLAHRLMAEGHGHGIYFALPTMATSNALYGRILKIKDNFYAPGSNPPIVLAHSARHLAGFYLESPPDEDLARSTESLTDNLSLWLTDNRKKALLASVGIGTIDQALVSILPRRHQSLRLFGLWRNILIVDEVHAYDPYVNGLLMSLICDHARIGGSTILLSATLPQSTRNQLIGAFCEGAGIRPIEGGPSPYPVVIHVSSSALEELPLSPRPGTSREVHLRFFENESEVVAALQDTLQRGGCACWIRNTVYDVIEASRLFETLSPPIHPMIFHARFVLGDRLERENEVIRRFGKTSTREDRVGTILLATQVVEQSLDLDFDFLVTDLAPIDLVIQRAGRLHRHARGDRGVPVLGIHAPALESDAKKDWYSQKFPRGSFVYPSHGELWLTQKILHEKGKIRTPDDARVLIEGVYANGAKKIVPPDLLQRDFVADQKRHQAADIAMVNAIKFQQGYQDSGNRWPDDGDVPTRLGEPSVTLRLGVIDTIRKVIRPLFDAGQYSWDMSQVTVQKAKMGSGIVYQDDLLPLVNSACNTMADKGCNAILVPLRQGTMSCWENRFTQKAGGSLDVRYSKKIGLEIEKN